MESKDQILQNLRDEKNRWEDLLAGLSEARIAAPDLPDDWSIKDVMAHLMAWQQVTNARLDAALSGRAPVFPDWFGMDDEDAGGQPHHTNAHIFTLYHDQTWPAVYRRWQAGFENVLESVESLSEKDILQAGRYPWMGDYSLLDVLHGTFEHHNEHMDTLRAWLRNLE